MVSLCLCLSPCLHLVCRVHHKERGCVFLCGDRKGTGSLGRAAWLWQTELRVKPTSPVSTAGLWEILEEDGSSLRNAVDSPQINEQHCSCLKC